MDAQKVSMAPFFQALSSSLPMVKKLEVVSFYSACDLRDVIAILQRRRETGATTLQHFTLRLGKRDFEIGGAWLDNEPIFEFRDEE
ncbi:uncharacterized protein ARMOST_01323 [Armillaria ostoyae]|uniref:Uncharacterized protein n=1 Tax=Armillaria ostoyae TaxID=47428 RepID=A0A284QNN9_ARMOS|nr:uncharacterized protein ARMOST_01323 [Armillaria ostoyae]